jgi:putative SOS response-associated peptidase YedK
LWDWEPNFNIAPGTVVPVVAYDGRRQRKIVPMRWGLHPHWKKEPPEGRPMFNARVETAAEKPSFRTPFRRRRALIPASGWYEWEGVEKPKTPNYIYEKESELTVFAGLWDQWRVDEGVTLLSATILTTAAVGPIKHLHHRMPVRLPPEHWHDWLDWDARPDKVLRTMLESDDLEFHEVSQEVNSGRAQGAHLIQAA